jgi:DNA-binding response OmpR family regulator
LEQIKSRYFSNDLNGSGLGLHIVNQFLRLFHSELKIHSTKNIGSQFAFILDLEYLPSEELKMAENDRIISGMDLDSGLLIDDDPQIIHYLEYIVEKMGVNNITAIQALDDLNQINKDNKYDLIITDALFPLVKTNEYIVQLNNLRKDKGLILLHSGIADPSFELLAGLGIDAFVPKPIESNDFVRLLENLWYEKHISIPDMKMFYKDYDYDTELIKSAMKILLSEWRIMTEKIVLSIRTHDQVSFNQVYHKLIASIKRFNLKTLQDFLMSIQQQMKNGQTVDDKTIDLLSRKLEWKEQFFKEELVHIEHGALSKMV